MFNNRSERNIPVPHSTLVANDIQVKDPINDYTVSEEDASYTNRQSCWLAGTDLGAGAVAIICMPGRQRRSRGRTPAPLEQQAPGGLQGKQRVWSHRTGPERRVCKNHGRYRPCGWGARRPPVAAPCSLLEGMDPPCWQRHLEPWEQNLSSTRSEFIKHLGMCMCICICMIRTD